MRCAMFSVMCDLGCGCGCQCGSENREKVGKGRNLFTMTYELVAGREFRMLLGTLKQIIRRADDESTEF